MRYTLLDMNKPFFRAVPPPIPEAARRSTGPVQSPRAKQTPPPIPPEARRGKDSPPTLEVRPLPFSLENGKETFASSKHPDRNEDSLFVSEKRGLSVVADGMGGIPAGDYASNVVASLFTNEGLDFLEKRASDPQSMRLIRRVIEAPVEQPLTQEAVEGALDLMIRGANDVIERYTQKLPSVQKKVTAFLREKGLIKPQHILPSGLINLEALPPEHQQVIKALYGSVSSTVAIAKTWIDTEGLPKLTVANIGDSRVYRYRDETLDMLTQDHSAISVLLQNNAVDESGKRITDPDDAEATVENAFILNLATQCPELRELAHSLKDEPEKGRTSLRSIRHMMTMTAGGATTQKDRHGIAFEPFIATHDIEDQDIVITMSDGVSDNLPKARISDIIKHYRHQGSQAIAHALTTEARHAASIPGGKPDDISVIVTICKQNLKN